MSEKVQSSGDDGEPAAKKQKTIESETKSVKKEMAFVSVLHYNFQRSGARRVSIFTAQTVACPKSPFLWAFRIIQPEHLILPSKLLNILLRDDL